MIDCGRAYAVPPRSTTGGAIGFSTTISLCQDPQCISASAQQAARHAVSRSMLTSPSTSGHGRSIVGESPIGKSHRGCRQRPSFMRTKYHFEAAVEFSVTRRRYKASHLLHTHTAFLLEDLARFIFPIMPLIVPEHNTSDLYTLPWRSLVIW